MSRVGTIRDGVFDGSWCSKDGELVATIVGGQITFQDGHVERLESRSEAVLSFVMDDEVFSARLDQPGILKWNDGDVWVLPEVTQPYDLPIEKPRPMRQQAAPVERPSPPSRAVPSSRARVSRPRKSNTSEISVSQPGRYRILQGVVFKKPGSDPTADKGFKKVYEVGSTLSTTGRCCQWKARHGSQLWVELDSVGSPGWVLVQGEGVGVPGPLLQKVEAGEVAPFILRVASPQADDSSFSQQTQQDVRKCVLKPSASMTEVKAWISLLFRLSANEIRILKPQEQRPSNGKYVVWHNLGNDEFVSDNVTVEEAGFTDGCLIQYIYTGLLTS